MCSAPVDLVATFLKQHRAAKSIRIGRELSRPHRSLPEAGCVVAVDRWDDDADRHIRDCHVAAVIAA